MHQVLNFPFYGFQLGSEEMKSPHLNKAERDSSGDRPIVRLLGFHSQEGRAYFHRAPKAVKLQRIEQDTMGFSEERPHCHC